MWGHSRLVGGSSLRNWGKELQAVGNGEAELRKVVHDALNSLLADAGAHAVTRMVLRGVDLGFGALADEILFNFSCLLGC